MVTTKQDRSKTNMGATYANLKIVPYMRSPSQVFRSLDERDPWNQSWNQNWNQNWSQNWTQDWTNHRDKTDITINSRSTLSSVISIRRDEKEHGFIFNKQNEIVFLADKASLNFVESIQHKKIREIAGTYPKALELLGVA